MHTRRDFMRTNPGGESLIAAEELDTSSISPVRMLAGGGGVKFEK